MTRNYWLSFNQAFAPVLFFMVTLAGSAQTAARLALTSPAELVDCAPVTQTPCMSAALTPVDANGNPARVDLPASQELAAQIKLTSGPSVVTPFFASAGPGPDAAQHMNVVLLLVDISGSMNQRVSGGGTRFESARGAIAKYLEAMQPGSDRIAIVPFESRGVVSTIRSAVFAADRSDAMEQLKALPQPAAQNNTALFQAVFSGVQSLRDELTSLGREGFTPDQLQPHLIVMTDGRNEVERSDDPQLLNGPLGLEQAAAQMRGSHMDVVGIGFGDRDAIDVASMRRLSSRFFYAADANELLDALHVTRAKQSHAIHLAWTLPEANRLELSGRDQRWIPTLALTATNTLSGDSIVYIPPAVGPPSYSRRALPAEMHALIAVHPPSDAGWSAVVTNLLVLAVFALLIVMLWFWVPRLVWGDHYAGAPPASHRWSGERPTTTAASGVQIRNTDSPSGFETATASGPIQRSAAQKTQVIPRDEFSRTRLTFNTK
jgi:Ca-activated chloride channel family protein